MDELSTLTSALAPHEGQDWADASLRIVGAPDTRVLPVPLENSDSPASDMARGVKDRLDSLGFSNARVLGLHEQL